MTRDVHRYSLRSGQRSVERRSPFSVMEVTIETAIGSYQTRLVTKCEFEHMEKQCEEFVGLPVAAYASETEVSFVPLPDKQYTVRVLSGSG